MQERPLWEEVTMGGGKGVVNCVLPSPKGYQAQPTLSIPFELRSRGRGRPPFLRLLGDQGGVYETHNGERAVRFNFSELRETLEAAKTGGPTVQASGEFCDHFDFTVRTSTGITSFDTKHSPCVKQLSK
jgi:hypothetical protein